MRIPKYMSPTSIKMFWDDREGFYRQYLADAKTPREPQNKPMAIGSAFDAYVKYQLHKDLFGKPKSGFELDELFESMVEPQNRDWAKKHGLYVFMCYQKSGSLAALLALLNQSVGEPRFEARIDGLFLAEGMVEGVPLMGKPDVYFMLESGPRIIDDWKVNGFCSKSPTSPMKGFQVCRDGWDDAKHSRSHNTSHELWVPQGYQGLEVNSNYTLEQERPDWAAQQAIYAWLLGEKVGSKFVVGIEQLVCSPNGEYPKIRVASHRNFVSEGFQLNLASKIARAWEIIQSGWIFRDMEEDESRALQAQMDSGQVDEEAGMWR